ncbi:phage-like protein [Canicola haemoglobinophilus]|uniref:Phage-like protein n=1 Tax=Canicola haemoglobinophilus TaxID=733 RepID=A0A377HW50_9PAST|nr:phage-like protein [Canicola haemoglobinophilus]
MALSISNVVNVQLNTVPKSAAHLKNEHFPVIALSHWYENIYHLNILGLCHLHQNQHSHQHQVDYSK